MESETSTIPFPLRVAVVGLQTFTILAIVLVSMAVLIAMFWKNILVQNIVQTLIKIFPVHRLVNLDRFKKTHVQEKIDTDHCAICYCDIDKEVKSNCGHVFCGDCLIQFWHSKKQQKINCPLCRCDVNVLVPSFALQQPDQNPEHEEMLVNINKYNIACSNCPTTILQLVLGSPDSMKMFLESLPARKSFIKAFKMFVAFLYGLGMIIYLISPSEEIPEHEVMFGLIDESASFIYLFLYIILLFILVA